MRDVALTFCKPESPNLLACNRSAEDEMWLDFAIFLVACQVLTFGIIRIVEAMSLI
jgi:hypothetical protein